MTTAHRTNFFAPLASVSRERVAQRVDVRAAIILFALVAAGHALGTLIIYQFDHTPSSGESFFPATGVTLAALLLTSYRYWPVVTAATFASEYVSHFVLGEPALVGFGLALSDTLGPLLAAWVIRRILGRIPRLDNGPDLMVLFLAGVLLGPLIDASIGPPFARMITISSSYLETAARWWTGDALGALIVGSFLLAWLGPHRWHRPRGAHVVEAIVCAAALLVVAFAAFYVLRDGLAYLVLAPLAWAALRFGVLGATAATLALTTVAEWATVTGHGQFAAMSPDKVQESLWTLQLFLAVACSIALLIAFDVGRTHRAEAARRRSERAELQARQATDDARLAERRRLARELHDNVSQALFASAMHARSAEKQLVRSGIDAPRLTDDVSALRELTASALTEMRALIFELRPDALVSEGVVAALERQAAAIHAHTDLTVTVSGPAHRLPLRPDVEEHLYRIALEALNNAVKHAAAKNLTVQVTDLGDVVELAVSDDGVGFDPTHMHPGHLGLHTMRERAAAAGGTLELSGRVNEGTTVRFRVPAASRD
jgi:signal transduction histidine kinase